MKITKKR